MKLNFIQRIADRRDSFSLLITPKIFICGGNAAFFVFPATGAAEKHLVSEKTLIQRFFKGTGVVLAGIECSPKIRDFRANGIPAGECVDFFDTLNRCLTNRSVNAIIAVQFRELDETQAERKSAFCYDFDL